MKASILFILAFSNIAPFVWVKASESVYDWGLIYVMSYDNNLDHCAEPIIKGLQNGIVNERVAVSVLKDRLDKDGLQQLVYSKRGNRKVTLKSDDITDNNILGDFLNWSVKEMPARRYALIFLNHGGGLEYMCADNYIEDGIGSGHLKASQVGPLVRQWSSLLNGGNSELSLLFLQQCGRASIENLYNFRGSAKYIMASQINVGAPNTYYTPTLKALCNSPAMNGRELGIKIMDTDKHYTTYVLVDGLEVDNFRAVIRPVSRLFSTMQSPTEELDSLKPCFTCRDEKNYDLAQYMTMIFRQNSQKDATQLSAFLNWYHNRLIVEHRYSKYGEKQKLNWTGISTYGIHKPSHFNRYQYLPIFSNTSWGTLRKSLSPELKSGPIQKAISGKWTWRYPHQAVEFEENGKFKFFYDLAKNPAPGKWSIESNSSVMVTFLDSGREFKISFSEERKAAEVKALSSKVETFEISKK